jgi:hypothetical protein
MPKYNKIELAQEIEHLKQQLRERERRIMKWLVLIVNFNSHCSDNCSDNES